MEGKTTPGLYADGDAERGAGGKIGRKSTRRPPATPYDRPPSNNPNNRTGGGWLWMFVDPAYRLVTGATTKILPTFLFKSSSADSVSPSNESQDTLNEEGIPNAEGDEKYTASFDVPKLIQRTDPSEVASDRLESNHEIEDREQDSTNNSNNNSQILRIEQLIKGKSFSRDEIHRLIEVLNCRGPDLSDYDGGKKNEIMTISEQVEAVPSATLPRTTEEGNRDNRNTGMLSTPFPASNVKDEVGQSPVEIAKAFMGNRHLDHSALPRGETTPCLNNEFDLGLYTPSSSTKLSTCWPGAIVQGQHSYATPGQRGRYVLHDFPRTPYGRTICSKSQNKMTRLQADGSRNQTTSSTPLHQSRTPIFEKVKSRNSVVDDSYGSVGPIRRIRNKFSSEVRPRGSSLLNSSKASPPFQPHSVSNGILAASHTNLDVGQRSKNTGSFGESAPLLNPSYSLKVKRILEELDRNKPTPKEKAAELRLAASWRKSPPEASNSLLKDNISLLQSEGQSSSLKKADFTDRKLLFEGNKNEDNSNSEEKLLEKSTEARDATVVIDKASGVVIHDFGNVNVSSLVDVTRSSASHMKFFSEEGSAGIRNAEKKMSANTSLHKESNGQHVTTVLGEPDSEISKKLQPHSPGTKPVLPSISVGRRDLDNGSGFTFPISSSSSVILEPPTPSFLPFSSSITEPPEEVLGIPSYSFGTKKSATSLVFSFPSTSSSNTTVSPSELKFNFGSDKKTRLSFSSAGKGGICY